MRWTRRSGRPRFRGYLDLAVLLVTVVGVDRSWPVDRDGQIPVRTNRHSVPIRLIGKRVRVILHASHLVVYDQNVEVARHERLIAKGVVRLDLDHCLEVLVRKPGAFPGSTALEQARSAGKFTPIHDAWWTQAMEIHGERGDTRALSSRCCCSEST
ncbi:Mu transposase domain-containing protein [Streptomyces spiramenti]|uniref:Mu transposase domain-containing protein n=1 Tax=Streptomyces spiramenti TaxID=2720606 RepID=UPI001FD854FF|nr:hypothetical protein [Streptomyces spiramenti]